MSFAVAGNEFKRFVEVALFGGMAVVLHVLLAVEWPELGAEAGGAGGKDTVSFQGATQQIETMVANWTRPPDVNQVLQIVEAMPQPVSPTPPIASARIDDAPNVRLKVPTIPAPEFSEAPTPDTQSTSLQQDQAQPVPKVRPQQRPEPEAKAADRAQQASVGAQKQRAAGSGGAATAGNRGTAQASVSPGAQAKALSVWGARIRSQVERRKRHPSGARAGGTVGLRLTVGRDGRLQAVSVGKSSGHPALDNAALSAVKRAGRFRVAPKELTKSAYSFSLSMTFKR